MRRLLDKVEDALAPLSPRLSSLKFVVEAEAGQLLPAAWGKMVQQVYDQQQQPAQAAPAAQGGCGRSRVSAWCGHSAAGAAQRGGQDRQEDRGAKAA